MTRYLLVSFSLLLFSCGSSLQLGQPIKIDSACIEKFRPVFKSDLYSASVDVVGKHISGLMLFKAMLDSSTRLVFTNEAGIKFFDFEFQSDGNFIVHQVIQQLNKKPVINTLRADFELMMMRIGKETPLTYQHDQELVFAFPREKETDCVVTNNDCTNLLRLEKNSKSKRKLAIQLYGVNHQAPDSISITHFNFRMNIKLKHLERLVTQ